MQNSRIRLLKLALGYDLGVAGADGIMGPKTKAAIQSFQARAGLVVDGIVGPKTREALARRLNDLDGSPAPPTVAVPPSYDLMTTRCVQQALLDLGYDLGPAGVDGIMGSMTTEAVKSFQRDARITVDGKVGPQTREALARHLATR